MSPSWYCQPMQSALNSRDHVEHGEVVAQLLARRALVEVRAPRSPQWKVTPLSFTKRERVVDALVVDARPRSMIHA